MDKDATQESTDAATASDGERTRQTDAESQSEQSTAKISTKAGLWWPRATLQSLFDANVDFYPRLNTRRHRFPTNIKVGVQNLLQHQQLPIGIRDWAKGWKLPEPDKIVIASVKSDIILEQMGSVMQGWTGPIIAGDVAAADAAKAVLDKIVAQEHLSEDEYKRIHAEAKAALEKMSAPEMSLDDAIELAKASLDEVKAQTEYQDQKAMRLLTVTTFLSALSGALFVNFSANYPLRMADSLSAGWPAVLLGAYVTFLLFVIAAVAGALVTFHATRTRFKYSKLATAKHQAGPTRSFLFFREMIGVSPNGWANSFVVTNEGKPMLRPQLKEEYLKNYVAESYLVAAKTADKLRYLGPAQSLLAWALRCLLLFVVLIALIQALVPKPSAAPTDVNVVWPTGSVSAAIRATSVPTANGGSAATNSQKTSRFEAHVQVSNEPR